MTCRRARSARTTHKRRHSALDETNQRKYRAMSVMEFASKINLDFMSRVRRFRKMLPSKFPFDYEQTKEKLKFHLQSKLWNNRYFGSGKTFNSTIEMIYKVIIMMYEIKVDFT